VASDSANGIGRRDDASAQKPDLLNVREDPAPLGSPSGWNGSTPLGGDEPRHGARAVEDCVRWQRPASIGPFRGRSCYLCSSYVMTMPQGAPACEWSCGPLDFFVPTPTFAELESGQ
jgi:hypothetical protein